MTEGSLRIAMHRLRIRFGELLRGEVAQTVADPADVDDELRDVIKSWLEG
jgi:RNA polymerase sigma-70 factor (ECF subfamily)